MNLYSAKADGSVKLVEKETTTEKVSKRKGGTKKTTTNTIKELSEPNQEPEIVSEVEPKLEQTYEELLEELEQLSDDGSTQSLSENVPPPQPQPNIESVEIKKRKRQPSISKNVTPTTPRNSPEPDHDNQEPPNWFLKYIENMKSFQNEASEKKKTKRVVKTEANDYAKQQWQKPEVRQKVTNTVDSHLTKMYRQIFGRQ
jgi:hypothetical protein